MTVRVRFAPSPTGHLHVGGARTAIFNWLYARRHGGSFIVRVEDTDVARSTRESEAMVLDDLRWLGLHWDEGPDIGGPHAPYRQSERTALYRSIADQLLASERAYRCYCSEEALEASREQAEREGRPPHYDRTCMRLTREESQRRSDEGEAHVVRFHVRDAEGDVEIDDLIRGSVSWKAESLGDFIVLRSDGMPTYNFSVVVDDHEMEISHVVRAEEHLTNTHRQVLLYRALGWQVPHFAHVSLILGEDRSKLSKRHGATSVSAFGEQGFIPEAMLNYLILLGWSPPDGEEIFDAAKAAASFDFARVNPAPAVFDIDKFSWMNGQYLHSLASDDLRERLWSRLGASGWANGRSETALAWWNDVLDLVKTSLTTLRDIDDAAAFLFRFDPESLDDDAQAVLAEEGTTEFLELLEDELESGSPRTTEEYQAMASRLRDRSGRKGKQLFMPLRVAITGRVHGPELAKAVPLLVRGAEIDDVAPILAPLDRVRSLLERVG